MTQPLVARQREEEVWCFWGLQAQWQRQAAEQFAAHVG